MGNARKQYYNCTLKDYSVWKDNVNVVFPDDKNDSVISVISVSVFGMQLVCWYNLGNTGIQYFNCMLKDYAVWKMMF